MSEEDYSFEIEFLERVRKHAPKELAVLEMLAHYYTRMGKIDEGLELDEAVTRIEPENPVSHYNLACSLALKNRKEEALASLDEALKRGYRDLEWMRKDPDLFSLHGDPHFSALIAKHENSL